MTVVDTENKQIKHDNEHTGPCHKCSNTCKKGEGRKELQQLQALDGGPLRTGSLITAFNPLKESKMYRNANIHIPLYQNKYLLLMKGINNVV